MQIKNSFDNETICKLKKAIWIAAQYAFASFLLEALKYFGNMDLGAFTPIVSALLPLAIEFIRQWRKGVTPEDKTPDTPTDGGESNS